MSRYGGAAEVGHMWTASSNISKYGEADMYPRQPKRSKGTTAAVVGGGGLAALGVKQMTDANRVPEIQQSRTNYATNAHYINQKRLARAQENLRHETKLRDTSARGTRWLRRGKVRRAEFNLEDASRAADRTRAIMYRNKEFSAPKVMESRAKNMRRGGKVMIATGLTAAATPLAIKGVQRWQGGKAYETKHGKELSRGQLMGSAALGAGIAAGGEAFARHDYGMMRHWQKEAAKGTEGVVSPALRKQPDTLKLGFARNWRNSGRIARGVAALGAGGAAINLARSRKARTKEEIEAGPVKKTITQSRYGGNVESGRAWRGPEKKDNVAGKVAAGAGAIGLAGGVTALGAHHAKPERMADRSAELRQNVSAAQRARETARQAHLTAGATRHAAQEFDEQGKVKSLRQMRNAAGVSHPVTSQPWNPKKTSVTTTTKKKGKRAKVATKTTNLNPPKAKPSHAPALMSHFERETARTKQAFEQAGRATQQAEHTLARHPAERAANLAARTKLSRVARAGTAVGAAGGLVALGAGLKAEADRRTGWSKPTRRNA